MVKYTMTPMLKILHTGDLHLGFRQYGLAAREGDFYNAVAQLFKKAVELGVDAILIAGDTFDATKPPSRAVKILKQLVECVKGYGIRVLAIDGNHDLTDGDWMEICGIEPIGGKIVTVVSKVTGSLTLNVAGIDSCRPAHFTKVLEQLQTEAAGRQVPVLAIHQAVAELADFNTQDYSALQIAGWVKPLGVQYVAMGDIHSYRETVIGGVRFAYSGSAEIKALDETADKSAIMIMYDGTSVTTGIVPVVTRPFFYLEMESEEMLDNLIVKIEACQVPPLVIIRYTPETRDIARRAEALLKMRGCMYRLIPVVKSKNGSSQPDYNRDQAMFQLKDAVSAYFEEESDEHQLVFQLLNAPDNVKETVAAYLKSKGL